ncbi:LysR family transcriptional regulator [Vibrio sp. ZSDE26]|uniref:LysR family transcriptional regulator n=1 Tax=Vibrio amylolyticus TaxID=2847292 RepID=A0A9X1XKQ2_9VIBR|nr:LysR family transcriptional regulator [Vibrio amylolyticus]MCK6264629.1 LysR family transcriptional regulator [Vibrio amylolyticus]
MNNNEEKLLIRLSQAAPMLAAIGEELSFTKAADTLNIQQSAVSHRVRSLEQALGITLFERTTRKLVPTEAGLVLCRAAKESQSIWPKALDNLRDLQSNAQIKLSLSSSLAMKWMIPILRHSYSHDLNISLNVSDKPVNFDHEPIDVAIRFGIGPYPGLHSTRLSRCTLQPVASPKLIRTFEQDVKSVVVSHETMLLGDRLGEKDQTQFDWTNYFEGSTYDVEVSDLSVHRFDRADLMLQAAVNGIGVALGRTLLIEQDIKSGFLEKVGPAVTIQSGYWLVCKPSFAESQRYESLCHWLKEEIKQTI